MQKSTKQQLKTDMERLTAQRERYALAAVAADERQAHASGTSRTLARLEDEILGLQEAIDALDGPLKVSTGEFSPVLPAMGALVDPRPQKATLGSIAPKLPPPTAAAVPVPVPVPVPDAEPKPPGDYTPVLSPTPDEEADAFDAVLLRRRITVQAAKVMTSAFAIGFIVAAIAVWTGTDDARAQTPNGPTVAKSAR